VIAWGETREAATALLEDALGDFQIEGVSTLIPFHRALLATDEWRAASTCRDLLADRAWLKATAPA
jgi:acetyl/propionyl-CoA carboxylase alpha subunit